MQGRASDSLVIRKVLHLQGHASKSLVIRKVLHSFCVCRMPLLGQLTNWSPLLPCCVADDPVCGKHDQAAGDEGQGDQRLPRGAQHPDTRGGGQQDCGSGIRLQVWRRGCLGGQQLLKRTVPAVCGVCAVSGVCILLSESFAVPERSVCRFLVEKR